MYGEIKANNISHLCVTFLIFNPKVPCKYAIVSFFSWNHKIQGKIIIEILFAEPGDTNQKAEIRQVQGFIKSKADWREDGNEQYFNIKCKQMRRHQACW